MSGARVDLGRAVLLAMLGVFAAVGIPAGCGGRGKPAAKAPWEVNMTQPAETAGGAAPKATPVSTSKPKTSYFIPADEQAIRDAEARADDLPRVLMQTSKGDMVLELYENEAPNTVGNFVSLVEKGFYDGLTFHRVLDGFMAQGGCPDGSGSGGPGYKIRCECSKPNARKHYPATLSMAHAGKDTGGSQFFLTFSATSFLNGKHTVFGRVIQGEEVLDQLQRIDPQSPFPGTKPDKILKATVIRKRNHEYAPDKVSAFGW